MGGGAGLSVPCRFRVVTEKTVSNHRLDMHMVKVHLEVTDKIFGCVEYMKMQIYVINHDYQTVL
jgi:hypothetical protein